MAEPVGGDALCGDPRKSFAESFPEMVVASTGERTPVAVPQQGIRGEDGAAALELLNAFAYIWQLSRDQAAGWLTSSG